MNKLCNLKLFVKKKLSTENTNKGNTKDTNKDINKINDKFEQSLKDYNLNEEIEINDINFQKEPKIEKEKENLINNN